MPDQLVARVRTPWTRSDMFAAILSAWNRLESFPPNRCALAIVLGHATIECGRDGIKCWQYNFGNFRGIGPTGLYTELRGAYEFAEPDQVPPGAIIIPPPSGSNPPQGSVCYLPAAQRFRAYEGFKQAADDYLTKISERWPYAMKALRDARVPQDSRSFVIGLVTGVPYFTSDVASYSQSLFLITSELLRTSSSDQWPRVAPDPPPEEPQSTPQAEDFVGTLVDPIKNREKP